MKSLLTIFALMGWLALPASAVWITLWEDDGSGQALDGVFTSILTGQHTGSTAVIGESPERTGHLDVHEVDMRGFNGNATGTEWNGLRADSTPYSTPGGKLWHPSIVPGVTPYRYRADIFVPSDTTMDVDDTVTLLLRFNRDTGEFGDRATHMSSQVRFDQTNTWVSLVMTGVVEAVNDIGLVINEMEPIVSCADRPTAAGNGVFAAIDNARFEVFVDLSTNLPPRQVIAGPPATLDVNTNGLSDIWEATYGAEGLDPFGNEDGDALLNHEEEEAGTDPFDPLNSTAIQVRGLPGGDTRLRWPALRIGATQVQSTDTITDPDSWINESFSPTFDTNGFFEVVVSGIETGRFYRAITPVDDLDSDQFPDWMEEMLGFGGNSGISSSANRSYDTTGDGNPDATVPGDIALFNEVYGKPEAGRQPSESQAARFLLQSTFGPRLQEIQHVRNIGFEQWIDEQMVASRSYTRKFMRDINNDFVSGTFDPALAGYYAGGDFVRGFETRSAITQNAVYAEDQLRQRVAFALSQILIISRGGGELANKGFELATYYDLLIDHAFGRFEDLLLQVSLSPSMGHYLSSFRNQKADESILRFPDENYAREIMQLFSIGLWELNLDGTRILDGQGEPIATYGNAEITEMARVFTGLNYDSNSGFNGGWRDDDRFSTTPMKVYASEHDFGEKTLLNGTVIAARTPSDANGMLDVKDAVAHLVAHSNTAPFICRQLIQFLVSSNPSTGYVHRVSSVFVDNGSGVRGDLGAVVRAILLDDEARNPAAHMHTPYFGYLREPFIRTMHLARVMNLGRFQPLHFWDWNGDNDYRASSLQEPMNAPSVFNFYRPDFRLPGALAENGLDSPAFGITDSYSSISFPNYLWKITENGFKYNQYYDQPPDWSALEPLAFDVDALLDRVNLLFCAGTMSASSREIIRTAVEDSSSATHRSELAAYLALMCPEGACLK